MTQGPEEHPPASRGETYVATTRDIRVAVAPRLCPERSEPNRNRWFFLYTVRITNAGPTRVQLLSRHWIITDALGKVEEVRGPGVVGQQPVLNGGESFEYTSGCPLLTPFGSMEGTYELIDDKGRSFDIEIPAFALRDPKTMQ